MIVTFYSYKGGVGRSMAMANVAAWLCQKGLRVLVVDWDLEAPGLEQFFLDDDAVEAVRSKPALIDMLALYKRIYPSLKIPDAPRDAPSNSAAAATDAQNGAQFERTLAFL